MRKVQLISLLVATVLIACLLSVVSADSMSFSWGMSEDEVIAIMGSIGEKDTETSKGNTLLRYYDQKFGKYEAVLVFAFNNNSLFCKMYGIDDDSDQKVFKALSKDLISEYGPSDELTSVVVEAFKIMGLEAEEYMIAAAKALGIFSYQCWAPSSDMNIVLFGINNDDQKITSLIYIQPIEPDSYSNNQIDSDSWLDFDGL